MLWIEAFNRKKKLWPNRSSAGDKLRSPSKLITVRNNTACNIYAAQHMWFLIHKVRKLLKRGGAAQSRKPQLHRHSDITAFFHSGVWQVKTVLVIVPSISCISLFALICWNLRYRHSAHEAKRTSDDWNIFFFFFSGSAVSDKSYGGYCGNTHPFPKIKLPLSQEIDREDLWK